MTQSISVLRAAELVLASYDGPSALPRLAVRRVPRFAQAYLLSSGPLVIPGMNETRDRARAWKLNHVFGRRCNWSTSSNGVDRTKWLQLFCEYASEVARAIHPHRPTIVLGHSLGAGMASILAHAYDVPAICFSSPAVADRRHIAVTPRADILNINITTDWLPKLLHDKGTLQRFGTTKRLTSATSQAAFAARLPRDKDEVHHRCFV